MSTPVNIKAQTRTNPVAGDVIPFFAAGNPDATTPQSILAEDILHSLAVIANNLDLILVKKYPNSGPFGFTSGLITGGTCELDVGSTNATAITTAGWYSGMQINVACTIPNINFDGTGLIFRGLSGTLVTYDHPVGAPANLSSANFTGNINLNVAVTQNSSYSPGTRGPAHIISTTAKFDSGRTYNTNYDNADSACRPSRTTAPAQWYDRTAPYGLDDGPIIGCGDTTNYDFIQNDAHTHKKGNSGGQSHNDNAYNLRLQPGLSVFWVDWGIYTTAGAYLAATPSLFTPIVTFGYQQVVSGVMMYAGGGSGNNLSNTTPGGCAWPARSVSLSAGTTNNFSPGIGKSQFWAGDAGGSTLTGMVAGVNGEEREVITSGGVITVNNQDSASSVNNRFTTNTGAALSIPAGSRLEIKCVWSDTTGTTKTWHIAILNVAAPVTSFNGRVGAIAPTSGDYTVTMVPNAARLDAANNFATGGHVVNAATGVVGLTLQQTNATTLLGNHLELWGTSGLPGNRKQAVLTSFFNITNDPTRQGTVFLKPVGVVSSVETDQAALSIQATSTGIPMSQLVGSLQVQVNSSFPTLGSFASSYGVLTFKSGQLNTAYTSGYTGDTGGNLLFICDTGKTISGRIANNFGANGGTDFSPGKFGINVVSPNAACQVQQFSTSITGFSVTGKAARTVPLMQLQTDTGATLGNVGGRVANFFTDVASTHTDGTFDTLFTNTMVPNSLLLVGDSIKFELTLKIVPHATLATNQIQGVFGGLTFFDSTPLSFTTASIIIIKGEITKTATGTCRGSLSFKPSGSATNLGLEQNIYFDETILFGLTLTATNTLKFVSASTGANSAAGDVTCVLGSIDVIPKGS